MNPQETLGWLDLGEEELTWCHGGSQLSEFEPDGFEGRNGDSGDGDIPE